MGPCRHSGNGLELGAEYEAKVENRRFSNMVVNGRTAIFTSRGMHGFFHWGTI